MCAIIQRLLGKRMSQRREEFGNIPFQKKIKQKAQNKRKPKKKTLKNNNNKKKQKERNNKHIYAYGHTRAPRHKYSNTSQEAHRRH